MVGEKKVFIFDFDGVIVDTVPALYHIYITFLKSFGIQGNRKEFDQLNGPKLTEIISILKKKYNLHQTRYHLLTTYQKRLSSLYSHATLYEGVGSVLMMLKNNNFKISLASSCDKTTIQRAMTRFNLTSFFDYMVSGDDVGTAKPSPEIYRKVIERFPSHDYYVVEDSENGLQASIEAGMKTIFFNPEKRNTEKTIFYEINKLSQVENILKEIDLNCYTISRSDQIELRLVDTKNKFESAVEKKIQDLWIKEKKDKKLFNGDIVAYRSHNLVNNMLTIQCYITQYKYFYSTLKNPNLNLGIKPIGVAGVIIDQNNDIIFGKRNMVTEYQEYYELLPSGSVDLSCINEDGILFEEQLVTEFEEETNIDRKHIKDIKQLCLIFDRNNSVYDICSIILVDDCFDQLLKSSQNDEYQNIRIVNLNNTGEFIKKEKCVPSSVILLNNLFLNNCH